MRKNRDSLFEFTWNVPENGHQWVEAWPAIGPGRGPDKAAPLERVLIEIPSGRYRNYNPLRENPVLFRKFAALDGNETGILTFASEFGALTLGNLLLGPPVLGDYSATVNRDFFWLAKTEETGRRQVYGDSLDAWRQRIGIMRQAVEIWDLVRNGDRVALERFIQWKEGPEIHYRHPSRASVIASPTYHPELLAQVPPGNTIIPAKMFLVRELQENLTGRVSWRPVLSKSGDISSRVVPQSLLGCLWLELEETITGDRTQIPCPVCSEWFEVRSSGARSDKMYCSPRCKTKAHREVIGKARQLRAEGKTPKQIAKAISRDEAVVKNWLRTK
jgi:hypothetical protein